MKPSTQGENLLQLVYLIYFSCGMAMCFEGAFNPEIKEYFELNYSGQMLMFFAKNIPFLLFSVWIGWISLRAGLKNCLSVSLLLFSLGTLLLIPAISNQQYWMVLTGFFLIGTGFNFLIVAGNPLLSMLGDPDKSSSRLNFGNALGAIAQIIAPLLISFIIPSGLVSAQEKLPYIFKIFYGVSLFLFLIFLISLIVKDNSSFRIKSDISKSKKTGENDDLGGHRKGIIFGFIVIFFAIGTESGIFGLFRNFMEDPSVTGYSSVTSQRLFTLYFAVFAAGRLFGSFLQKKISPSLCLIIFSCTAITLLPGVIFLKGVLSVICLITTGFFISVFFPTIFSLSIQGLGNLSGKASGILSLGILGAAIIPIFQGRIADISGLRISFIICSISYFLVFIYAISTLRTKEIKQI